MHCHLVSGAQGLAIPSIFLGVLTMILALLDR
jgi:hypothetical protein